MKTFVSTGEKIDILAPAAIAAGAGLLVGSLFGIAQNAAAVGAPLVLVTWGVFDMTKTASQAWTVGQLIYWDDTAKRATNVVGTNKLIGVAVLAVGGGAGETVGRVRLNGAYTS